MSGYAGMHLCPALACPKCGVKGRLDVVGSIVECLECDYLEGVICHVPDRTHENRPDHGVATGE